MTVPSVAIILLAAGGSSRMGRPKQLLPYGAGTLLRHAAETALATGFSPILVVLGAEAEACAATLAGLNVTTVCNDDWAQGLGYSIRAGVEALEKIAPTTNAVLVLLHDQPAISALALQKLAHLLNPPCFTIAASFYGDSLGVPAVFDRSHFAELKALDPAAGAKSIIARHGPAVAKFDLPEALDDIDAPADYDRLRP